MIELLLGIAILAVLTGFLAGGLAIGRRAFDADRSSEISSETDAAVQTMLSLIASALPVQASILNPKTGMMFVGREQSLSFVALSEGRSLRGGPYMIVLRRSGSNMLIDVKGTDLEAASDVIASTPTQVVVLKGVRDVKFGYFGKVNPMGSAGWQSQWLRFERLPDLVSILIEFEDTRRNEPARTVALRQK